MAKIEMDLSEYQEIQKVNRLLEESLDKERKLQEEVVALKQEKIDILKDNEKTVTIVERIDHVDTIKTLRPHEVILQNLFSLFKQTNNGSYDSYSINAYDHMGSPIVHGLAEAFFATERQDLYSQEKSVTRVGFDEVRAEVKAEFEKEIKDGYEMRERSMEGELKRLRKEAKANEGLISTNEALIKDNKRLVNNYDFFRETSDSHSKGLDKISRLLKDKLTFFNRRTKIGLVKKVLRETKDAHRELCDNRK
jgi:hypothetical protein